MRATERECVLNDLPWRRFVLFVSLFSVLSVFWHCWLIRPERISYKESTKFLEKIFGHFAEMAVISGNIGRLNTAESSRSRSRRRSSCDYFYTAH